jgi:hypothetical protein
MATGARPIEQATYILVFAVDMDGIPDPGLAPLTTRTFNQEGDALIYDNILTNPVIAATNAQQHFTVVSAGLVHHGHAIAATTRADLGGEIVGYRPG